MRNLDANDDLRGRRDRPSPVSPRRGTRPGCPARPGPGSRSKPATRHRAHAGFLPIPAGAASVFPGEFGLQPLARRPLATVPGPTGLLANLVTAAQAHFAATHYATAIAFLELVQFPDPQPARTWQRLGHLHFSLAEYDAAGRAYGYAAAYDPRDASLQVRLAHTCLRLDDVPSFEGYLERALALDPESAPALQLLADLNRDTGRYEDAARFYQELIAVKPDHYENLLSLALCHSYLGDSETAMDYLQRAGQTARGPLAPTPF